jgi:hypothetical protein
MSGLLRADHSAHVVAKTSGNTEMAREKRQPKGLRTGFLSAAFATASLCAVHQAAQAGPVTEAGELVGLAMGAPLPEGLYFVDTASIVSLGPNYKETLYVNIPVVAWSTPWKVLGGRVEGYIAVPELYVGIKNSTSTAGLYNPALLIGEAWDLGNGLSFSNFVGGYAPMNSPITHGQNEWVFNERAALSYTANGYDLTAHITYGVTGDAQQTGETASPDYINYDLTATKTFGKWEVGPVAFGTNDLSRGSNSHLFEMGGLVGYGFGPLSIQTYMTHSVSSSSDYGDGDTRFFLRLVVPLWSPAS